MSSNQSQPTTKNFFQILELYQKILQKLADKNSNIITQPVFDPLNIQGDILQLMTKIMSDPEKLLQSQTTLTQQYLQLIETIKSKFMGENTATATVTTKDKRFADIAWENNPFFDFLKQSYLLNVEYLRNLVKSHDDFTPQTSRKLNFMLKLVLDAMAPNNFLLTNPQVLKETLSSGGENIVRGLTNFLRDLEDGKHFLDIKTTTSKSFVVGDNIAATPGKVVYQNTLMQLIHYQPVTDKTYLHPILITPPWINKYYILDLSPETSFVKWLTEQGYSVFIISWVNPDKSYAHKHFIDYMFEGVLAAVDAITATTGSKFISAIGYCIGGTLLSMTLAYMAAKNDNRIQAATFFTTLIDFSDGGELTVFIDEQQVQIIEKQMEQNGYFDGRDLGHSFNLLRANDMIWSFVINNYLMGEDPLPFDLLHWNSDSTRLPEAMHKFYLRNFYLDNLLVKPTGIVIDGCPIDVTKIAIPCYFLSAKDDYIVPWQSTYAATHTFSGPVKFVLTSSGHVAGVFNHPKRNKYCYFEGELADNAENWLTQATMNLGSWWDNWHNWQKELSGKLNPDSIRKYDDLVALEAAPGSYVKQKYT
jgi:polyhydroxyalkanoate synthase